MKKLLIIAIVVLASCQKNEKACYSCMTNLVINVSPVTNGYPQITQSTKSVCDMTDNDATDYEKKNSENTSVTQGGVIVTGVSTTYCTKK